MHGDGFEGYLLLAICNLEFTLDVDVATRAQSATLLDHVRKEVFLQRKDSQRVLNSFMLYLSNSSPKTTFFYFFELAQTLVQDFLYYFYNNFIF